MMWDKSTIFTNNYNEEISNFYNNLWKNQQLFDKFVTYIKNLQNNYGEKQCFFDFITGMETSYLVFNNEIEQLNSQVNSAAESLRKFRISNQANGSEWDELSNQIRRLIELLNQFLTNKYNVSNNIATSSKCNQNVYTSKVNNFTQTGRFSFEDNTSKYIDESIESEVLDLAVVVERNYGSFSCYSPQVVGPIKRKKTRHSTSCCSCGKSKIANKSTQTKTAEQKKRQEKSGCCLCPCKCCKEDSKLEKDDVSWVLLYEVQTQTGTEICPRQSISPNQTSLIAENFIQQTEPSYLLAKRPPSSTISPTPYGVSTNSLPEGDRKVGPLVSTTMDDNIKLLLKLLEEIEKSLQVVKQLHATLLAQTGDEPTRKSINNSTNSLQSQNNDINLHLTITLENNIPETQANIELDQIQDNRKSITPGKRLSSFFKRKNDNSTICEHNKYVDSRNSMKSVSINDANLYLQGDINNNHTKSENINDNRRSPWINRNSDAKSIHRESSSSDRRSSFKKSLYENDPEFTKCLLRNGPNLEKSIRNTDEQSRKSGGGNSNRRSSFQQNVSENNPNLGESLRTYSETFRKSNNSIRRSSNKPDIEGSASNTDENIRKSDSSDNNNPNLKESPRNYSETFRKSGNNIRRSSNNPYVEASVSNTDENIRKLSSSVNNKKSSSQQSEYENNPNLEESPRNYRETFRKSGNSNRRSPNNQSANNQMSNQLSYNNDIAKKHPGTNNNKRYSFDLSFSRDHTDTESVPQDSDERPRNSDTNKRQGNITTQCHGCDNNHAVSAHGQSFVQNVDTFRCSTCQHRCVYCKTCFEMHESLYNCLKIMKDGKRDQLIRPSSNTNTAPPRDDKHFWAEAMLYFMPSFLSSLRKDTKPGNLNIPNPNLMPSTEQTSCQVDQKNAIPSQSSSPECDRKPKYKWVLIRMEYFEDGTRQIHLINDTDIPENSYLTASK